MIQEPYPFWPAPRGLKPPRLHRRLIVVVRDWWRGYTDADIASMREKYSRLAAPGQMIEITDAELRASKGEKLYGDPPSWRSRGLM